MLENSGLVLGVDSSFGLLTWLHNPRHVGMALLIHGWLLHLTQRVGGGGGRGEAELEKTRGGEAGQTANLLYSIAVLNDFKPNNAKVCVVVLKKST